MGDGHCIESEDFVIVVDKWDASFLRRPGCKPHYFFLTHLHADHIKGLTSTWSRTVYTSPFNAWLLPLRRNVKPILLKEVELNVTHTIRKCNNEVAFQVTLLDANHCPGAVMFLFQGKFGNILYTGDFRYTPRILENPILSPIIRNKELSVLYLDNTYAAPSCIFPTREEALKEVLKIIDENPDSQILIGMRQLGKEEVLRAIALHVNERVCVSNQRLQILSKLEYEDVFTTDATQSRIHAVELHTITQRHCQESSKTVSIKLTSMYECGKVDKQRGNIYVVPYSDHSSHTEIKEFVDHLRPLKLYPIVLPKVPKVSGDVGPWHRMSAVNCVVPEEILQLCGPSSDSAAPTPLPVLDNPYLQVKYHPAPKPVSLEKKSTSITYIDEGMSFLPFDSLGSHLTNNNKARKHIKASWTRLAPKLLAQKGIKFDSSPEKTPEIGHNSTLKEVEECSSEVLGPASHKGDICAPSVKENSGFENDKVLFEIPLSDDELDMPSSASDLTRRLNLTHSINGVGCDDRKSECSSEITDLFEDAGTGRMTRNRSKCESPAKGVTDFKDSVSDVSSTRRTTRSQASVVSVPVVSRPRTRLSHGSDVGSHINDSASKALGTRKSLRNSPPTKVVSPISPKSEKNGLGKKSISLEILPMKSTSKKLKQAAKEDNDADIFLSPGAPSKKLLKVANASKNNPNGVTQCYMLNMPKEKKVPVVLGNKTVEDEKQKNHQASESFDSNIVEASNVAAKASGDMIPGTSIAGTSSSTSAVPSTASLPEKCTETSATSKKTLNGNMFFNGITINSPGRKRVPSNCDWDSAQEIVKKETAQALKALETLDQMRGFKTRNVTNRSGTVALRRMSADNVPKSPVKKPASPGTRRRTASIISQMRGNFSEQLPSTQVVTPSQPLSSIKGISPILPDKDTKSPRKGRPVGLEKTGAKKSMEVEKKSLLVPKIVVNALHLDQSNSDSHSRLESTIDKVPQNVDGEDLPSPISVAERVEPKVENCMYDDSEAGGSRQSSNKPEESHSSNVDSSVGTDVLNQGLFLTDATLASASTSRKKEIKQPRRTFYKKQSEVNVGLMKLKMDFAMSRKGPKRLSLPSRLSLLRQESAPLQSKEKVQDWRKKISLHLRKSPQRRYKFKSPNKLRENARRNLASILRSGRNLNTSQGYHGDVEDCNQLSQPIADTQENTGYMADNEGASQATLTQASSVSPSQRQTRSSLQSTDSVSPQDSKLDVLNEVRRSSRLSKEEVGSSQATSKPARSMTKINSKQENSKTISKSGRVDINAPQKKTAMPIVKNCVDSVDAPSAARFSDRLSERSRMITSKATDSLLAQKSPNIFSLMADAFKNGTGHSEAPETANILSSMAENFKKLDEGARVSPSLSIQLVPGKVPVASRPTQDKNCTDWGVQITRVESSSSRSQASSLNSSPAGLPVRNTIPKSLSIEIIPDSNEADTAPRKGPSPPTVTILPEVVDLESDSPEPSTQSTIHSLPIPPGPRRLPQGGVRWPRLAKSEVLSPPPAVWKEKRNSSQTGENVIIDIQTQEDPQKVPHCPVHCTCGAALRQGTCMGTMRNLIEEDADCLYEVPLSPEDFEDSGAMLALGKGWIEACFDDPEDRDEFFKSYEDILPTVSDFMQRRAKAASGAGGTKSTGVQPSPQHVRRVLAVPSPKPVAQLVKQTPPAPAPRPGQSVAKTLAATSSQTKAPATVQKVKPEEQPKKKPASGTLLKEIEKKIKAYNDEQSKKETGRKPAPPRRTSAQSTSSSNSIPRSTKQSLSPAAPMSSKVKSTTSSVTTKRKLSAPNAPTDSKQKKMNTSSSGLDSPENKKSRCNELERLSDTGKNAANKKYRVSVRRSLDHLMTRQKLRSDRRVKNSGLNRS